MLLLILPSINLIQAEASSKNDIITLAKKQIGVPYRFGGDSPKAFDCSGFIKYIFTKIGIDLPRTSTDQSAIGKRIANKIDLQVGDLVFFKDTYKSGISHSGIYIGNNDFISATTSKGIAIASINSNYWGPRFVFGTRVIIEEKSVVMQQPIIPELKPGQFHDVLSNNPAYLAISEMYKAGYISGVGNSYFKPDNLVTREQAALILNRNLQLTTSSQTSFSDVAPGSESARAIAAMKEAGIILGVGDGTFRPNELLTRAQMAIILDRAYNIGANERISNASITINDVPHDHWAYNSINALIRIDTTNFFKKSSFKANNHATRADFAVAAYVSINATK